MQRTNDISSKQRAAPLYEFMSVAGEFLGFTPKASSEVDRYILKLFDPLDFMLVYFNIKLSVRLARNLAGLDLGQSPIEPTSTTNIPCLVSGREVRAALGRDS